MTALTVNDAAATPVVVEETHKIAMPRPAPELAGGQAAPGVTPAASPAQAGAAGASAAASAAAAGQRRERLLAFFRRVLPPLIGFALFIGVWYVATLGASGLPGPVQTWHAAVQLFADPFYRNGPNDQGIGWNILSSLQRVAIGFGFAALVGIPAGFVLGRFRFMNDMVNPLISLLRPVSPLAWLPIGLLVFKRADPAATWTIFICSIWPMIINTAVGVQRVDRKSVV